MLIRFQPRIEDEIVDENNDPNPPIVPNIKRVKMSSDKNDILSSTFVPDILAIKNKLRIKKPILPTNPIDAV